jgi:hypothetical protein
MTGGGIPTCVPAADEAPGAPGEVCCWRGEGHDAPGSISRGNRGGRRCSGGRAAHRQATKSLTHAFADRFSAPIPVVLGFLDEADIW